MTLKCDILASKFAFTFSVYRYIKEDGWDRVGVRSKNAGHHSLWPEVGLYKCVYGTTHK